MFDSVRYENGQRGASYEIDSEEAHWNTGKAGLGHRVRPKEGYFPVPPQPRKCRH